MFEGTNTGDPWKDLDRFVENLDNLNTVFEGTNTGDTWKDLDRFVKNLNHLEAEEAEATTKAAEAKAKPEAVDAKAKPEAEAKAQHKRKFLVVDVY